MASWQSSFAALDRQFGIWGSVPHKQDIDTAMDVVVVESPAKAKTIEKYLGAGFTVLASYGHVRDLPAKDGSVRPDEDFAMDYETDAKAAKHLGAIAKIGRASCRERV